MKIMSKPQLLITFVPAMLVLAIIAIVSVQLNISMTMITRDVTARQANPGFCLITLS